MGQTQSGGAVDDELRALQESTRLGENQLRAAQKGFRKTAKQAVTRAEFVEVLRQGGIASKLLAGQFWKIVAGSGETISLENFVVALALVGKGDAKQRLDLTFRLLDVDGDGFVSRQELTDVLGEVHAVCGQLVSYSGRVYHTAADFAAAFFAEFDPEKTDKLSREAYENGAFKSLEIISTLCLYGSALPVPEIQSSSMSSSSAMEYGPRLPDSIIL